MHDQKDSADLHARIAARVIGLVVPATLTFIPIVWLHNALVMPPEQWTRYIPSVTGFALLLAVWVLVRQGKTWLATHIFVWAVCAAVLLGMWFNGGVSAPIYAFSVVLAPLFALIYSFRGAVLAMVGGIVVGALFLGLQLLGQLPIIDAPHPSTLWLNITLAFVLLTCITTIPRRILQQSLDQSEQRRVEAEAAREREQAVSQALADREAQLHSLIENLPGVCYRCACNRLWTMDFITGEAEELTGYSASDFLDDSVRSFASVIHEDDRPEVWESVQASLAEGAPFSVEYRIVRADGTVRWVQDRGKCSCIPGEDCRVDGVILDITERKLAAISLSLNEERTRMALDVTGAGVWEFDVPSQRVSIDPLTLKRLGFEGTAAPLTVAEWGEAVHPDDQAASEEKFRALLEGKTDTYVNEFRRRAEDGSWQWLASRGRVVEREPDGTPRRILGTHVRITERKQAELALSESERKYRTVFDSTSDGLAIQDDQGRIIDVNARMCEMFCCDHTEALRMCVGDLSSNEPPYTDAEALAFIRRAIEEGPQTFKWRCRRTDESLFWAEVALNATELDGEPRVIASVRDSTDRMQAQELLEKEKQYSTNLVQASPAFFVAIGLDGKVRMMNTSLLTALGYEADEVLGRDYLDTFVPQADQETLSRVFERLTKTKEPTVNENRILAKDGRLLLVEWHGRQLLGSDGQPESFFGVGIDITERRMAEQELQKYKEHLEELVEERTRELAAAKEAAENTLAELRSTQGQLVQSEKLAVLGRLAAGVAHELNTPLGAIGATAGMMGKSYARLLDHTGELADWLAHDSGVGLSELLKVASSARPLVLSSRERRELRNKIASDLQQLDIDDPRGLAELLIDLNLGDTYSRYLQEFDGVDGKRRLQLLRDFSTVGRSTGIIDVAVNKASRIVRALQTYSKRTPDETASQVDVREEIETILTLYHSRVKEDVKVVRHYQDVPPLNGFREELGQVWTNLIINAFQAMNYQGRLVIAVRAEGGEIVVSFKDSGCGIPDSVRDRVFEPFFTTKMPGEACGLGLDICRAIVERHHGHIGFESTPAEGTTFWVRLPIGQPGHK